MKKWGVAFLLVAAAACNSSGGNNTADKQHLQLLARLETALKTYPDSASLRMQYVNTLDSLRMYPQAIAQVDSMIQRDSLNNGLWFARGQLLESNGDTLAAIASYEQALIIYPSVEAQLNLANLFAERGDARALELCQNVSRMGLGRETDAACDFIAGVYHARTGNRSRALAFFDRAVNNNYTMMEAYMEKGFLLYEAKDFDNALKTFDRAITVNNTYADAYYWRAKTQEAMGNTTDALTNYERSLGLDPKLEEARQAIDRLK